MKKFKEFTSENTTTPVQEGVIGAVLGGLAGSTVGPLGTIAGAYAGHKIQQRASKNPSIIDATIASKMADLADRRTISKTLKEKPTATKFKPSTASRWLRDYARRKSGIVNVAYREKEEQIPAAAQRSAARTTAPPAPAAVQRRAAPTMPTAEVHPTHVNHPGHGSFPPPIETTPAAQAAAAQRRARLNAIALRVAQRDRTAAARSSRSEFDKPGTRQKVERPTSSIIAVEEKGK